MNQLGQQIHVDDRDVRQKFIGNGMGPSNPIHDANGQHPLVKWFGTPGNMKDLEYDTRFYRNYQLPKAYENSNEFLGETVLGLVIDAMDFLLCEPDGLPLQETNNMHFSMSEVRFEEGLLDVIAEEGPGRLLRMSESKSSGTLTRKGKAILLEHGFFLTEQGQQTYYRQLQQMANATVLDFAYHTLTAMFNSRAKTIEWASKQNLFKKPYRALIRQKYAEFACFQKNPDAAAMLIDRTQEMFSTRGIKAEMLIVAKGGEYFFHGTETDYSKVGILGVKRMASSAFEHTTFRNLRLHFTRPYMSAGVGQMTLDPSIRRRCVGEYFKMFSPPLETVDEKTYKSFHRDIYVMDFNKDTWARISLRTAVENLGIWDAVGNLNPGRGREIDLFQDCGPLNPTIQGIRPEYLSDKSLDRFIKSCAFRLPVGSPVIPARGVAPAGAPAGTIRGAVVTAAGLTDAAKTALAASRAAPNDPALKAAADAASTAANGAHERVNFLINTRKTLGDLKMLGYYSKNIPDVAAVHNENLSLIKEHAMGTELAVQYNNYLNDANVINKNGFILRSNETLKTGDAISGLLEPILSLKLGTRALKNSPTVERLTADVVSAVPQKEYVLHDDNEIKRVTGSNLVFNACNIENGTETTQPSSEHYIDVLDEDHVNALSTFIESNKIGLDIGKVMLQQQRVNVIPAAAVVDSMITKANFLSIIDKDIVFPFNILVMRPFVTMTTSCAIMGKGGSELGVNLFMNLDFMLSDDGIHKMHTGFLTMNHLPFIKDPLMITQLDDLFIREYLGGAGVGVISTDALGEYSSRGWVPPDDRDRDSIFFYLLPIDGFSSQIDDIIDIRSHFEDTVSSDIDIHFVTTLADENFKIIRQAPATHHPYDFTDSDRNTHVGQSTQLCYNVHDERYNAVIMGINSFWGPNVYPGCCSVLNARVKTFKDCAYDAQTQYQFI